MSFRADRSSAIPKFTVKAGLAAVTTVIAVQQGNGVATDNGIQDIDEIGEQLRSGDFDGGSMDMMISIPVRETWDAETHMPELKKLVVKKSVSALSRKEELRLRDLQDMRRETLPLAQSYEEFIRDYERREELQELVERLAAYSKKYDIPFYG